jgi:hypothetical protein
VAVFIDTSANLRFDSMVHEVAKRACALAALASVVTAQSGGIQTGLRYGENWAPTIKDSSLVAANFPDVNITLRSPAFLNPERVPARFANGTEGPTDDIELGNISPSNDVNSQANANKTTSFATLLRNMTG